MQTKISVSLQEEEAHFMRLVSVLHDLLICKVASKDKREELQRCDANFDPHAYKFIFYIFTNAM